MSIAIGICLILLILVVIASIITLTVYVVKWLIEFTILTKTLNDTTVVVKDELEPILGELKQTMKSINDITQNADTQMKNLKKVVAALIGFVSLFVGKFKFLSGSFMKGFMSAFNLFRKK